MIQKTYWGQGCGGKEESLHKSQCNSTELCVNAILQADYLPQYCRSNSSPSRLNSLLIKLPQTVSYDGLDPHLPLRSTPHPTAINFSIYLSLGWVLLHSHVDTGRRNKFAIGHAHGHHHNTATFSCSIGARLKHGLPYPVGLKREAFQKNINTRTHTKLLLMEELKEVTERRSADQRTEGHLQHSQEQIKTRQTSGNNEATCQYYRARMKSSPSWEAQYIGQWGHRDSQSDEGWGGRSQLLLQFWGEHKRQRQSKL